MSTGTGTAPDGDWINAITDELIDWTDIDTAEQLFASILDPGTAILLRSIVAVSVDPPVQDCNLFRCNVDVIFFGSTGDRAAPRPDAVRRWLDITPSHFRFSCKLPREITHQCKLRDCSAELNGFLRAIEALASQSHSREMTVLGHSQGGLLTKLTATDTGDKLVEAVLKTNRLENLGFSGEQEALVHRYLRFEALPFVRRVVFISTPHRGSYLASSFARRLARKFITFPSRMLQSSKELAGLTDKMDLPKDFKGIPTSLDSMSPKNPVQLALAEIPLAPGVKGHSIIAVKGNGDYHQGKDGLVAYDSAHVDYVESEFIVRGGHSCQGKAATIQEVRRILHEHVASLPPEAASPAWLSPSNAK